MIATPSWVMEMTPSNTKPKTPDHYIYSGILVYTTPKGKETGNKEEWCRRNSFWGNFHLAMAVACEFSRHKEEDFSRAGEILCPQEQECKSCGTKTIHPSVLCADCFKE